MNQKHIGFTCDKPIEQHPDHVIYGGTLTAGHSMNAARSLGHGTGFFTTFLPGEKAKEFADRLERYRLTCFPSAGVRVNGRKLPEERP